MSTTRKRIKARQPPPICKTCGRQYSTPDPLVTDWICCECENEVARAMIRQAIEEMEEDLDELDEGKWDNHALVYRGFDSIL